MQPYSPQIDSMLDAVGALLVGGLLLGAVAFPVVYAIYAAIRFGIEGQPTDMPVEQPGAEPAPSTPSAQGEAPPEKKAA